MDPERQKSLDNLAAKTGRPVAEWLDLARSCIPLGHKAGLERLKSEYGIGHGYANTLMLVVRSEEPAGAAVDPVDAQYAGPKAALRPIYEAIVRSATGLGPDVEIAPKKATVSLRRAKQFALITPATKTRIDLGLNLPGVPGSGRLVATTGMCTHKIALESTTALDDEVLGWLRAAYDRAG
ncbi:MAG: DUF5655 domain-containing protein [Nakamurella sp.]